MKSSEIPVLITVSAVSAVLLSGCEKSEPTKVCVDAANQRMPDAECQKLNEQGPNRTGHIAAYSGVVWAYLHSRRVPAVGDEVKGATFRPEPGQRYSLAPEGGVNRGGFGTTARASGKGPGA